MKIQQITNNNNTNFGGTTRVMLQGKACTPLYGKIYAALHGFRRALEDKQYDVIVTEGNNSESYKMIAQKAQDYVDGKIPTVVQLFTKDELSKMKVQ